MRTFRITSVSNRGGKAMGGLRGSSKIGTSSSNKRAQSRKAYGGKFFFNIAPFGGYQIQDGSYFLAYRSRSSASSHSIQTFSPQPAGLLTFSTSGGVQTLSGDKVPGANNQTFTWNYATQRYEMSSSEPYGTTSFFRFDYSPSTNTYYAINSEGYIGTVYTPPSGPNVLDTFYLYTMDESGNKTYIYTSLSDNTDNTDSSGRIQSAGTNVRLLIDGTPIDETGIPKYDNYRIEPVTCLYTKYLTYQNAPYNPVKYYSIGGDGYLDFTTESYVTLQPEDYFENYMAPTAATLDPNASSTVNQGVRAQYNVEAFECKLVPPSLSKIENDLLTAKVYKEQIQYGLLPSNGNNGNYLITWYNALGPQLITAQDSSNNPEISYKVLSDPITLTWIDNDEKYSVSTNDYSGSPTTISMKFSVMPDDNDGTSYLVQSNFFGRGVVVPLPSGPSVDDIFTLYSLDSSNNKQYVYFNNSVSTGNSSLVLGEPDPSLANASDYSVAEFKVYYEERDRFYPGSRIPMKYYSITNNTNAFSNNYVYFSVDNDIFNNSYTAMVSYRDAPRILPENEVLDINATGKGERIGYGIEAFMCQFSQPTLDNSQTASVKVYKEKYVAQ